MEEKISNYLGKMKELIDLATEDAKKFDEKKNGAAGTRVRKAMMEIREMAKQVRVAVSEAKKK